MIAGLIIINGFYHSYKNFLETMRLLNSVPLAVIFIVRVQTVMVRNNINEVHDLYLRFKGFLEAYEEKYTEMLRKEMKFNMKCIKLLSVLFGLIFSTPFVSAILISFLRNDYVLVFPGFLPFTSMYTIFGFVLNSALQAFYFILLSFSFMHSETVHVVFTLATIPMVNVFICELKELENDINVRETQIDKIIERQIKKEKPNIIRLNKNRIQVLKEVISNEYTKHLEARFIDMIKEFHKYENFVKTYDHLTYTSYIASITVDSIAIGLSLFTTITFSYSIGLALTLIYFFQIAIPCLTATIIDHQNKRLFDKVCEFPWFELSKSKQKVFLQFVHACQSIEAKSAPIIGSINMELFTTVMNSACTYLMYMLKFYK